MNELIAIEDANAMDIFIRPDGLEPFLETIRCEIDSFVPDISSAKGRKEVASMASKVAKSKVYLDNHEVKRKFTQSF